MRFPVISQIILNNVDDNSLTNFKISSRENSNFLDNERFYWIRNIKKYSANFEEFQEIWKKVINKTPVEFSKNLAIDVHRFFEGYTMGRVLGTQKCVPIYGLRYLEQWHPLFIAGLFLFVLFTLSLSTLIKA